MSDRSYALSRYVREWVPRTRDSRFTQAKIVAWLALRSGDAFSATQIAFYCGVSKRTVLRHLAYAERAGTVERIPHRILSPDTGPSSLDRRYSTYKFATNNQKETAA